MITGHIPELIIIMVVALLIFGPRRLPEIGGSVGRGIRDFKRGLSDLEQHHSLQGTPASAETEQAVRAVPRQEAG